MTLWTIEMRIKRQRRDVTVKNTCTCTWSSESDDIYDRLSLRPILYFFRIDKYPMISKSLE